jgi:hypothetical protein
MSAPRITTQAFLVETANRIQLDFRINTFNSAVYSSIVERNKKSSNRGFKATIGKTTLLSYCVAGRILINLVNRKYSYFAMCGGDNTGDMAGIQGMNATYEEMFEMLDEVTTKWNPEAYQPDPEITILGINLAQ